MKAKKGKGSSLIALKTFLKCYSSVCDKNEVGIQITSKFLKLAMTSRCLKLRQLSETRESLSKDSWELANISSRPESKFVMER